MRGLGDACGTRQLDGPEADPQFVQHLVHVLFRMAVSVMLVQADDYAFCIRSGPGGIVRRHRSDAG
jgi:hypothetical protein